MMLMAVGCGKEELIYPSQNLQKSTSTVIKTYSNNMLANIDSIQLVTNRNALYLAATNSSEFTQLGMRKLDSTIGIYFYKSGESAVVVSDDKGNTVFTYIVNTNTNKKLETLVTNYTYTIGAPPTYVVTSSSGNHNSASQDGTTWGNCMDNAIDELYDDWDDAPVETFACWMTGPLCAIGGGLACGIQTWF